MSHPGNKVLPGDAKKSRNFFQSDIILREYLVKHLSAFALDYMDNKLHRLGEQAALMMDDLSLTADKKPPELKKRNPLGEEINEVEFHPAYWRLMDLAAESEMFFVKYDPELRREFHGERHKLGFAAGQLYSMSELGVYCPLCMTDGAAHLVDNYTEEPVRERLLPKLSARTGENLYTGAMFLTEKAGGSDLGANLTEAVHIEDNRYHLNGEKWFCSNVNADVIMALARTGPLKEGTSGLSLFLIEKYINGQERNPLDIIRLKDKLGVRSMATGEVCLKNTIGRRIGEEGQGFKLMAEMINISRIYNSVGALGASRRALVESYQYLKHRIVFGKKAIEHALIREKFNELGALHVANFLLVWRTVRAMDASEEGNEEEEALLRIITPMAKWKSAEQAVYIVRECMELMGGNGYIEDFVMPKLLRDINVLPIWEGSGNIMVLDIIRAAEKSGGMEILIREIKTTVEQHDVSGDKIEKQLEKIIITWQKISGKNNRDITEATAKSLFEKLIHLYQMALMMGERDAENKAWIDPAFTYLKEGFNSNIGVTTPLSVSEIDDLIAWKY